MVWRVFGFIFSHLCSVFILYAEDTTFFNNFSELNELHTLTENTVSQAFTGVTAETVCLNRLVKHSKLLLI